MLYFSSFVHFETASVLLVAKFWNINLRFLSLQKNLTFYWVLYRSGMTSRSYEQRRNVNRLLEIDFSSIWAESTNILCAFADTWSLRLKSKPQLSKLNFFFGLHITVLIRIYLLDLPFLRKSFYIVRNMFRFHPNPIFSMIS